MAVAERYATEGMYRPDWLFTETHVDQPEFSRKEVTFLAGSGSTRTIKNGMVLGAVRTGLAATGAAVGGNTGNGTITASPTMDAAVQTGVYRIICTEPATNAGKFNVEAPNGVTVGVATVGVAFTGGGLTFTIADGSTDFASGDSFTVTVSATGLKYVPLDLAGTNGSEDVAGIALRDYTVPNGSDLMGVIIVRDAQVIPDKLTYPSGATTNQKAAIVAALEAMRIFTRTGIGGAVPA